MICAAAQTKISMMDLRPGLIDETVHDGQLGHSLLPGQVTVALTGWSHFICLVSHRNYAKIP